MCETLIWPLQREFFWIVFYMFISRIKFSVNPTSLLGCPFDDLFHTATAAAQVLEYLYSCLAGRLVSFEFAFIWGAPNWVYSGLSVITVAISRWPNLKEPKEELWQLACSPPVSIVYRVSLKRRRSVLSSTEKIARRFDGILCFENAEII